MKGEKMKLFSSALSEEREFEIKHAEEIFKIQEAKKITGKRAWELPKDSKYEYVNGRLVDRPIQRKNTDSKE